MASYQTFTMNRTTAPDLPALTAALRATVSPDVGPQPPMNNTIVLKKGAPWTPSEIASAQSAIDTAPETSAQLRYQRTSREKDVLATIALVVRRAVGIPTWNGWTAQQKRDAVLAEADVWVNVRDFLETAG
jgi:hypothetical protein